jgi:hypothetical protein
VCDEERDDEEEELEKKSLKLKGESRNVAQPWKVESGREKYLTEKKRNSSFFRRSSERESSQFAQKLKRLK